MRHRFVSRLTALSVLSVHLAAFSTAAPPAETSPARKDSPDSTVRRLMEKADPLDDDWQTERWFSICNKLLKDLAGILTEERDQDSLSAIVDPAALSTPLRPVQAEHLSIAGDFLVERLARDREPAQRTLEVHAALRAFLQPLRSAGVRPRLVFKVVGVAAGEEGRWATEVRAEAWGRSSDGFREVTAAWSMGWDPRTNPDHPLVTAIDLLSYEQVIAKAPIFEERTGDIMGDGEDWPRQLRWGAEYWYGKIDAVGEINFMGHNGIAIGDLNNDGLEDLYVAQGTGLPNKLLLRNQDGTVRDVAHEAGVAWLDDTKGVLFADMDNDGDQDLICAIGPTIVLCKNNGKPAGRGDVVFDRFISMKAPTPAAFYSLAAADYDLDGDLDIYGTRYVKVSYGVSVPLPFHDANNGPTNHLMRNDGDDRFSDVTHEVGLDVNNTRFSTACGWADYDGDGDSDLYVSNDFGRSNLYRNDGGRFAEVAAQAHAENQGAGMGVSWSDFDLDGDLDLHVSNMFSSAGKRITVQPRFQPDSGEAVRKQIKQLSVGNTLLVNQGNGTFEDASERAGVRMGRWAWGAKFVDFNNDGYDDLIVPNGFLTNDRKDDL